jgi:hypothetical protein
MRWIRFQKSWLAIHRANRARAGPSIKGVQRSPKPPCLRQSLADPRPEDQIPCRHRSASPTRSFIASSDSPTIERPALLSNRS